MFEFYQYRLYKERKKYLQGVKKNAIHLLDLERRVERLLTDSRERQLFLKFDPTHWS